MFSGEQVISVTVTNDNLCTASDVINILDCANEVFGEITNVFTPNADGVHDT